MRELQSRLYQLAWLPELTTGRYDAATRDAVRGFQAKRDFAATGRVDPRTWRRLQRMTDTPTHDQLYNVLHPGPAILASGAQGEAVRDLQARLVATAWLSGPVTGRYDDTTVAAVRGFQAKRAIPVTGAVDERTLGPAARDDRHRRRTSSCTVQPPTTTTGTPPRSTPAARTGRALCVDKSTNSLRWVVDGKVQKTFEVRFGSAELPTREGAFSVYRMSRDHVSSLYDTSMPFAMFFSGGQAVHYSPDFAANGYNGASHGCVNVRDYAGVAVALRPGPGRRQGHRLLVLTRSCAAVTRRTLRPVTSSVDLRRALVDPPTAAGRLVARTVRLDLDPGTPLLDLLPDRPTRSPGCVAARAWSAGAWPPRSAPAARPASPTPASGGPRRRRAAVVRDEVGEPGTGLVCFGSFAFADEPGDSVLVVPAGRGRPPRRPPWVTRHRPRRLDADRPT